MSENNDGRQHPTSFSLDDESREKLTELVQSLGMNRSAVVREAIKRMAEDPKIRELAKAMKKAGVART